MRAIVCHRYGPPESLVIGELPSEPLGPDGIRVRVGAASVNFPDTMIIRGEYQLKPPMPFAPGFEVAGEVIETGEAVTSFAVGDRVMGLTRSGYGGFAEEAVTDTARAAPIPAGMDDVTATAFHSSYATGYHALVQRGRLQPGETLLVLGAAGGVGLGAVELGKALGARVIGVASSAEKLALVTAHGADEVINSSEEDLKTRVRELTGGEGADVCLDGVGGDAFDVMSRNMAWGGRLLVIGFTSGRIPTLPVNLPLLKGYALVGVWWNTFVLRDPTTNDANSAHLRALYEEGSLKPSVNRTYALDDVACALNDVLSRHVTGKLVIDLHLGSAHRPTAGADPPQRPN